MVDKKQLVTMVLAMVIAPIVGGYVSNMINSHK